MKKSGSEVILMCRYIVAQIPEICNRTFHGWKEVPKNYKTRAAWEREFRRVAKGEKPTAIVLIEETRKCDIYDAEGRIEGTSEYKTERSYKLFDISQTKPIRKTALNAAQHKFYGHFVRHADRNKLIRWTKGEWRTDEDGERCWNEAAEVWGWRTFQEHFSLDRAIDHLNGKEIYGVFGAKTSSYLLIDLDLHNQPFDLFKNRLRVLLDAFHGKYRCHFQISDANSGGVHVILFFDKQSPLATRRGWLLNELARLDDEHPGVAFTKMKGGKRVLNIEVYPDASKAHRLPLCRGRTMLLEKPLPLVVRRGKAVQDVVGYFKWLHARDRKYMAKDEVFDFAVERLDLSCSSDNAERRTKEPGGSTKTGDGKAGRKAASLPMKGRTRGAIVGFWSRGEAGHFVHLNAAIAVTLRALYFEGLEQEEAVELIIKYVDELDNIDLSTRLANNNADIYRITRNSANRIWRANGAQVNTEVSAGKWRAVIERWRVIGFLVSDKSTWSNEDAHLGTAVDCEDIQFSPDERRLLVDEMVPVLVGKKQARKEAKQQVAVEAVKFFLRYVKCHDGEIARDSLPTILQDFDLKLGMDSKKQTFLNLLRKWGWIYIRAEYWHPAQQGKEGRGRARAYGIGPAMARKFRSPSSYNTHGNTGSILLCSTFSNAVPSEVEVPCFEDYFASLETDFTTENQEIGMESG